MSKTTWLSLDKRRCKTCARWGKPLKKRALVDHVHACNAPAPDMSKVYAAASYTLSFNRRYMGRDEGANCLFWLAIKSESPADERDRRGSPASEQGA